MIDIVKREKVLSGLSIEYTKYQYIDRAASAILEKANALNWSKMQLNEKAQNLSTFMAQLWKVHPLRGTLFLS